MVGNSSPDYRGLYPYEGNLLDGCSSVHRGKVCDLEGVHIDILLTGN